MKALYDSVVTPVATPESAEHGIGSGAW